MLMLTRRVGETILIGDDIEVVITQIRGGQCHVGIKAPKSINILRSELANLPECRQQNLVDEWNDTYSTNVKVAVEGQVAHFRTTSRAYLRNGEAVVFVGNIGAQPVSGLKVIL